MEMTDTASGGTTPGRLGRVLVVDDSLITTESIRQALQADFEVETLESGEACLERLAQAGKLPDLILLDIEMDGIDGFETCQRLRAVHDMPVIFVSSHDELEERLKAFDSGGDDFVLKPFDPEVILLKAQRIVQHQVEKRKLAAETESLKSMAMGLLRNIGDTGVLLTFMRSSLDVADYEELARRLLAATAEYNVRCHVQVRHAGGNCTLTPSGKGSPLEESVLEKSSAMGRIFQFRQRLIVNYSAVSILIIDLPADEDEAGKLRDNIAILAESAEAIAETIAMRKESAQRAEALQAAVGETADAVEILRELYRKQLVDTRLSLQEMIDSVEKAYFNMGLTDHQESRVSNMLREGAHKTLNLFDVGVEFDKRFAQILEALRPKGSAANQSDVWL
jgi:DNA-binding response OmpR family regulator